MTLRDLTDEEIKKLQEHCKVAFQAELDRRILRSKGPWDYFLAGYDACLRLRLRLITKPDA